MRDTGYSVSSIASWSSAAVSVVASRRMSARMRSEEHTSELQSLAYLVCRLLLEKKKKTDHARTHISKRDGNPQHEQEAILRTSMPSRGPTRIASVTRRLVRVLELSHTGTTRVGS